MSVEEKDLLKTLSKEGANIKDIQKSIRTVKRLAENEPLTNLYKIKQEVAKIEKTLKQSKLDEFVKEGIEQHIQPVKLKIPEWEEKAKKSFGQQLEQTLQQLGFELKGHYPTLKVSFYTLKIDLDNNNVEIWYGPEQEKLDSSKLIPETIAQKLQYAHAQITQRKFDDNTFLSSLYDAYRVAVYRNDGKIGDAAPITAILSNLAFLIQSRNFKMNPTKSNYRDYGRVFFSYDLYRLTERKIENLELSLVSATRAYTRRRADFLWIPSNEKGGGNYISHIKFREREQETNYRHRLTQINTDEKSNAVSPAQ
jgi:hypothetical protein